MAAIRLVVQADDLGMCRAVNEGIAHAATDGILTQTSVMAPTPWFVEGAAVARRVGLTTGLHSTLTCEWDHLRWSPLSGGETLRGDDGTFVRTVEAASQIEPSEAEAELRAQARRAEACGLSLAYVDPHMGICVASAYAAMCDELGVRFVYPGVDPHHRFDSIHWLSWGDDDGLADRTSRFVAWLDRLEPGLHFVVSHPAVDADELRAICAPDAHNVFWAWPTRIADLDALTSPDVRAVIERRQIELVSLAEV